MSAAQVLVLAKAPTPGRVKTRLCPPCTPEQAARVAAAALADTLDTVTTAPAGARVLVIDGDHPAPPGWATLPQRGDSLGDRLANAFADARTPGTPAVLIGMDTPQLLVEHLDTARELLASADGPDAVLGPAVDGGWWTLGLRDPGHATVLRTIATSTASTGQHTVVALRRRGLRVRLLPWLSDVDTAADARAVANLCPPDSRFARAVAAEVPQPAPVAR
ncbi:TIGR04282 family arsenosugar biosynthesis glycosyltransferase [Verrucosispora sp. WMMC514]|uniref:TIGR04282 family arsenosugar biosynthesis glycosyltransferase n=1 Tax=Verrucosispora sp. WMMC514 TaxID=3015156 RepID=UPI00248C02C5|nr:TIGR04282 family arsenosugar biosynthesis glycosyltransferase [Verrucosispora sp. WMMC514]WBB91114.1 TIGR04282 family arsenosugar biosynthesis glycosyltransferase [Verrucosispora sp. WMMC514]